MTSNQYDPKFVRRCRRRARFEKIKYTLLWAVPLALFVAIGTPIIYYLSVKTMWQNFIWVLAEDVLYAKSEDSLRASYRGVDVRLSDDNCTNIYKLITNADTTGAFLEGDKKDEVIELDFGNGHSIDIINISGDRCFIKYHGDKDYSFKIGVQGMFSKFITLTSLEGGSIPNSAWD